MYGDSFLRVNFLEVFHSYKNKSEGPLMVIYKNNGKYDVSNVLMAIILLIANLIQIRMRII